MKICLICKPGHADSGIGRYVGNLAPALQAAGHEVMITYPVVPLPLWSMMLVRKGLGWDLQEFFLNYPIRIRYPQADIYHFTSQNLATLLVFYPPFGKSVVTVHDLIPWEMRTQPGQHTKMHLIERFFYRLALRGLHKCQAILVDTAHTGCILNDALPDLTVYIKVVHLAV